MGKCKFNEMWLERDDSAGYKVRQWGRKKNDDELFCMVCQKTININKGFQAVTQHAGILKHKREIETKLALNQLHLLPQASSCSVSDKQCSSSLPTLSSPVSSPSCSSILLYNSRDKTTAAELIWCMKCVASDYSFSSCVGLRETFQVMFGDSVPQDFSLGNNKAHYLVTDALAPYFKKLQIQEMEGSFFTLYYDETTNAAGVKELQTGVRYWSNKHKRIICQHLETFYITTATATVLTDKICDAMTNASLPLSNLLMLGSDGPNVNKAVARLINNQLLLCRKKPLIDIGTCNIHIVHNAFLKGLEQLGDDISDLVFAIYHFFHGWPARWNSYCSVRADLKIPPHHFIKHVSSRWLTLQAAAERLLEQWDAVIKYFLDFIPKKKPELITKPSYTRVVRLLKKPAVKAEVMFVISSAAVFSHVTEFFQKEEPLVHILSHSLNSLVTTLLGRICKLESLRILELENCEHLLNSEHLLPVTEMVFSDEISKILQAVTEKHRTVFCFQAQKHYAESVKHIIKKSSLSSPLLKSFSCFHPNERVSTNSCHSIVEVARVMPWEVPTDILLDEWKLLQLERDEEGSQNKRVDLYWLQFMEKRDFSGSPKYPTVTKVVTAALSLSHGNADAERNFSSSCRALTPARATMTERTLNSLMTVKSTLSAYENKPYLIPISKELLDMGRVAYKSYNAYLEERRRQEEEKEKKEKNEEERRVAEEENRKKLDLKRKSIIKDEEALVKMRKEQDNTLDNASKLLTEANERLKKALRNKNLKEAALAQAMIEGVTKVQEEAEKQRQTVKSVENSVERKKSKLISDFFVKH